MVLIEASLKGDGLLGCRRNAKKVEVAHERGIY